jgi:sulfide:quinone oxidoreductase
VFVRSFSTAGDSTHHKIVVVGGGTAGISVASRLNAEKVGGAIIDPATYHYYQPAWTLVGGGVFKDKSVTQKPMADFIPSRFSHIKQAVTEIQPDNNTVVTSDGKKITYDYLVVCAGIQINWSAIPGLQESVGKGGVASNYSYEHVDKTWQFIKEFKGGNAIFTQPSTPIKCAGAPQKIMYLAEEAFREAGVRDKTNVKFFSGLGVIFGVKKYAEELTNIIKSRNIQTNFQHNLVALKPESKEAVFKTAEGKEVVEKYDFIHVTPPMGPPAFIKASPLADATLGWVDVNKETLQHVKFPNVFAVGDCSSAPKSRTAAAVAQEAPVAVGNIMNMIKNQPLVHKYHGYASCPLVTGKGKLILAEFDYTLTPTETFGSIINQGKENRWLYYLKTKILPPLYWHGLLKGKWNNFVDYTK